MTSPNPDNAIFLAWFRERADAAERVLLNAPHGTEAMLLAATTFDALTELWARDFPNDAPRSSSVRGARFAKTFCPDAPDVGKIAVPWFAKEMRRHSPDLAARADALLRSHHATYGSIPPQELDCDLATLSGEVPELRCSAALRELVEEFEYPALVYRYWRCPLAHLGDLSRRTHNVSLGERASYGIGVAGNFTLGIPVDTVARWIREGAAGYVAHCESLGRRPADKIDGDRQADSALARKWGKVQCELGTSGQQNGPTQSPPLTSPGSGGAA